MIRILNLFGDARNIGRQHGEQVADLRPLILRMMHARLDELHKRQSDFSNQVKVVAGIWEEYANNTLEMLKGMAEALQLPWNEYLTYSMASYLNSSINNSNQKEGCSTWAANGQLTRDNTPLLVKNRDNHPDWLPLQCAARVFPEYGNAFMCLTSAGSPGVFSSGINSKGLAAVDTFISSADTGPGIGRFSLMMDILQNFSTVKEAVDYLPACPHFGDGSVTLVDACGEMAVFEIAHSIQAVRQSTEGFLVSTNHFTTPDTRLLWADREPPHLRGNSQGRMQMLENALRMNNGKIDIPWCQSLMSTHGDPHHAVCRHKEIDPLSVTTSCAIYLPYKISMFVADGLPCQTPFEYIQLGL